jgi:hypothetical protein
MGKHREGFTKYQAPNGILSLGMPLAPYNLNNDNHNENETQGKNMKSFFTLLVLGSSMTAFAGEVDFTLWLSPRIGVGNEVRFVEDGVLKKGSYVELNNCVEGFVKLGEFGKFEGTAFKIALSQGEQLTKQPYAFPAIKGVRGCPRTSEYLIMPSLNVSADTDNDINDHAAICSIPERQKSAVKCVAAIDKFDDQYGPQISQSERLKISLKLSEASPSDSLRIETRKVSKQ